MNKYEYQKIEIQRHKTAIAKKISNLINNKFGKFTIDYLNKFLEKKTFNLAKTACNALRKTYRIRRSRLHALLF